MRGLAGTAVLVVGASRGIGLEIARNALAARANVVLTGRDGDVLGRAALDLDGGDRVLACPGARTDDDHRDAAIAGTMARFGSIDHLVINPAAGYVGPLGHTPLERMRDLLEANVVAPLAWCIAVRDAWMAKQRWLDPQNRLDRRPSGHSISSEATEYRRRGWSASLYPLQRLRDCADVAGAALFLMSERADCWADALHRWWSTAHSRLTPRPTRSMPCAEF